MVSKAGLGRQQTDPGDIEPRLVVETKL